MNNKNPHVAYFLDRYYKPERYTGRGEEYAAFLLASYTEDFELDGFCLISHFDSVTGKDVLLAKKGRVPNWAEGVETMWI